MKTFLRVSSRKSFNGQFSALIILLILIIVFFLLIDVFNINNYSGKWLFLTQSNIISNLLNQISVNAVIAFGMTLVILIRGIDLSVGSMVALVGVVISILYVDFKLPLFLCYLIAIIFNGICGAANGILYAKFRLPPFIVTLATMSIFRGLAFVLVGGQAKFISESEFSLIGNSYIGIIPVSVFIMLVAFLFFHIFLIYTKIGREIYLTGGNEEAAIFSGINVNKVKVIVFSLSGIASAISGILLSSRLGSGSPNVGVQYELDAIAATVIGGTSFNGGIGTIIGALVGATILGVINNGMNLLGITPYFQFVAKGLIILGAVVISGWGASNE